MTKQSEEEKVERQNLILEAIVSASRTTRMGCLILSIEDLHRVAREVEDTIFRKAYDAGFDHGMAFEAEEDNGVITLNQLKESLNKT